VLETFPLTAHLVRNRVLRDPYRSCRNGDKISLTHSLTQHKRSNTIQKQLDIIGESLIDLAIFVSYANSSARYTPISRHPDHRQLSRRTCLTELAAIKNYPQVLSMDAESDLTAID
jgi:hypothetical protein